MTDLPPLRAGLYRHYKGGTYQVLGYGHDANHEDRTVVVYLSLEPRRPGSAFAVRTVDDFFAQVHPDGSTCPGPEACALVDRLPGGGVYLKGYRLSHRPRFTLAAHG